MKLLNLAALAAAAVALPGCVQIVEAAWSPPNPDSTKVPAGTYLLEPLHSQIGFGVKHFGFTNYFGAFTNASGSLTIDPRDVAHLKLMVSVPTASVVTTSAKLDADLKTAAWLDSAQFPTMTFRATSVNQTAADAADVTGELTLHGVTRPLTLHAAFNGAGMDVLTRKETIGFQLSGALKRTDFGVTKLAPLVSDEVLLLISAAFQKK